MRKINSRPAKVRPALPAEERKSIVVTAKFDIDEYQQMMDKAITACLKTYQDIVDSRDFIVSLIKIYRNSPDSV